MALADFMATVEGLVRDSDGVLDSDDRMAAVDAAVLAFSVDRPRQVTVDQVVAEAGYRLALPAGWVPDFSAVSSIEYPVGQAPRPSMLDLAGVTMYRAPSGQQVAISESVPAGETVRITYTAHHAVDAETDTVPVAYRQGICFLAAAILCYQLASYYATDAAPTLAADTADHETKTARYRRLAKDYERSYFRLVGVAPDSGPGVASATFDMDRLTQVDRQQRFFHGGERR